MFKTRLHGSQSVNKASEAGSKCNIYTLNCTLEETTILNILKEEPEAMRKEIAAHIDKYGRTVKVITINLGIIECMIGNEMVSGRLKRTI